MKSKDEMTEKMLEIIRDKKEPPKDEHGETVRCKECSNTAVIDYNGHGCWVCKKCYDRLNDEFDEEYD